MDSFLMDSVCKLSRVEVKVSAMNVLLVVGLLLLDHHHSVKKYKFSRSYGRKQLLKRSGISADDCASLDDVTL